MKYFLLLIVFSLGLASCSGLAPVTGARLPAEVPAPTCADLARNIFMSESYEKDLSKVLVERKLITFKEKIMQVQYPRLEWINRAKKSFTNSLRNWNNNRHPSFYTFNDEEIVPSAKRYADNLEKILKGEDPVSDEETTKAYLAVSDWMKAFANYKSELDQLIEERISLQYNISLLKKLKLENGVDRDIQITIKREGNLQNEIITLRKEDKNLDFTIKRLKKEMTELDGTLIKNGKIKDRIIRQAMLQDMLTIVHRELEYKVKNAPASSEEAIKELEKLSQLLKNSDDSPSTFGVYKITNKVFLRELVATSKLDVAYNKIKAPLAKLKAIASDFFKNKNAGTEQEKIGFFKKIYAKITSITPKQVTIGGGSVVLAGIGFERYFWFKDGTTEEVDGQPKTEELYKAPINELGPEDQAHEIQLEETRKTEAKEHDSHSHVVEVQIDELTN
ncbi:MAG: hypothetical protein ACXVLQ_00410 [Bacteriovorax sp.]